ncbi:helix-turn-helix domain-containing protein [Roseomonas sp. JC162]|uniref:Helix-turn-helix domain-containing protein n=1 Tax=Neoroseomonas marina TaxID=1232220 RepID=A0A848EIR9_9PROT|nr:helix-turn-helix domain-containing protein [Neoroseomonas marina]NMJ43335.1 helix-turn-helix domain-containing protein [Neoroseomonas marina]
MSTLVFSTRNLPARDQREAWCAWFDPVFGLDFADDPDGTGFAAESTVWQAGGAAFSRVCAPRLRAVRKAVHIRRDPCDHWVIGLGGQASRLSLEGGRLTVPPGQPFVVTLGEPSESEREADDRLHLYLPRDRFAALAPELDRVRGRGIDGAAGRLLADYMRLLADAMPGLAEDERARMPEAISAMVAACVVPTATRIAEAAAQTDLTRLERVRQVIRRRLGSATLTPATLCREVGMSRSQLYRLLEGEGGVTHYIQRHRLRASYAALTDPMDDRSVAAIAAACGFHEPSTFSRTFRRAYGVSPSDARAAARAGSAPGLLAPTMSAETRSLRACLHGL